MAGFTAGIEAGGMRWRSEVVGLFKHDGFFWGGEGGREWSTWRQEESLGK